MNIYNHIMEAVRGSVEPFAAKTYAYDPEDTWPENGKFSLVMARDAAFELGGSGKPSVTTTLLTTDPALVGEDKVTVVGPELEELAGDSVYARIALLRTGDIEGDEDDTEVTFRAVQAIDFIKYHVFPKGFMMRSSAEMHRENVRIGRRELESGMTFRRIGNTFIRKYKENPDVLNAEILFITDPAVDFRLLEKQAKTARDVTMALTKIMEGIAATDCASCQLKPICDEVEELKELHFGKKKD